MADVGGLLFDKDAVYIDIPDWKVSTKGWPFAYPKLASCCILEAVLLTLLTSEETLCNLCNYLSTCRPVAWLTSLLCSASQQQSQHLQEYLVAVGLDEASRVLQATDCAEARQPMLQIQFTGEEGDARAGGEGEHMVRGLQAAREGVDEKLQRSRIQLFQARLTDREVVCFELSSVAPLHRYTTCFLCRLATIPSRGLRTQVVNRASPLQTLRFMDSRLFVTQGGAELRGDAEIEETEAPDSDADEDEDEGDEDDTSTVFIKSSARVATPFRMACRYT